MSGRNGTNRIEARNDHELSMAVPLQRQKSSEVSKAAESFRVENRNGEKLSSQPR